MSLKEMNIVFVYDRERCQSEEDDPINAIAYFHPSWVSDVHRLALCGQLMGVAQFLNLNFSEAQTIVLQSGKFILAPFGRFILVVGTDRNISDVALQYRSDLLSAVVRLYHKDLETVYEHCLANSSSYKTVADKFYLIFETYLPLLQHQSSVFNSVPTLKMPQSANCVFVEAIQTLQDCRQLKGVLGGSILYHNKIVSTQLPSEVSKMFVLTDPYRIKTTAAQVNVSFHLPVGVQLINVYMANCDFQKLRHDSQRAFALQNNSNGLLLPFQFKRKTKRDKAQAFSNIPEEEALTEVNEVGEAPVLPVKPLNGTTKPRPTHLALRTKNETTRDMPESGIHSSNSINFDEMDYFPQFIGKLSVVQTPLQENKILPGNVSLWANPVVKEEENAEKEETNQDETKVETESKELPLNKFPEMTFDNIRGNNLKNASRSRSLRQIMNLFTPNQPEDSFARGKPKFLTITDPSYPVFNDEGLPISNSMFEENGIEVGVDIALDVESLKFEGFSMDTEVETEDVEQSDGNGTLPTGFANGMDKKSEEMCENKIEATSINDIVFRNKPNGCAANEEKRRSMTLPIQPISLDPAPSSNDSGGVKSPSEEDEIGDTFAEKPMKRNRPDFPTTPLMSKIIAQLPFDSTWSSGISSGNLTPMTPIDFNKAFQRRRSSITKVEEVNEDEDQEDQERKRDSELKKVELFVCGQHNMTMLVAMEENSAAQSQELVQTLWETCISRLPKIESNLQQTLNVNVDGVVDKNDMNYSFMCYDPSWDVIQQGGHWTAEEMQVVEEIHADFKENGTFTETLVRCNDSVIYGYRCGNTEVYYNQPANQLRGLAQPGDSMGNATLNAKRRLERDHSIIIL